MRNEPKAENVFVHNNYSASKRLITANMPGCSPLLVLNTKTRNTLENKKIQAPAKGTE